MPTKPHRSKDTKKFLDEAVAKSTYHTKPVTRKRALTAALLAFPLGSLGVHNFMMRLKKRGFLHLIVSTIGFSMVFYPLVYGIAVYYKCTYEKQCIDISGYDGLLNAIIITGMVLWSLSIIWGFVEGVIILININRFPTETD